MRFNLRLHKKPIDVLTLSTTKKKKKTYLIILHLKRKKLIRKNIRFIES